MPTQNNSALPTFPAMEGNLALAAHQHDLREDPKVQLLCLVPCQAESSEQENWDLDGLAPARGILVGLGVSLLMWGLLIALGYWML